MDSTTTKADHQKPKNLIRSQYKDIMVKVDQDIYYLDRFQLALKSGYFEKVFTDDFADKNCDLIELSVMDTDTFHAIVDIIYGENLDSVINVHNYVSLLIAIDYLQMEVDGYSYRTFVHKICTDFDDGLPHGSFLDANIPRLCRYITLNANFRSLLPTVYDCVSKNLNNIREQDLDEFLSLSFDHFIEIILSRLYSTTDQRTCSKICTKWICYDLENRLPRILDLVNAAKVRYKLPNEIHPDDSSIRLPTINEHTHQDTLSRYFYKLLMYAGERTATTSASKMRRRYNSGIDFLRRKVVKVRNDSDSNDEESENEVEFETEPKLETFLKTGIFHDIVVKAGAKTYKLHRSMLKSASGYFKEIFSVEYSEAIAQCEGMPALPSLDKEYLLDGIDQTIFDIIIEFVYLGKLKITSEIVVRLFQAADILKIDSLLQRCKEWLKKEDNSKKVSAEDVIKILILAHENVHREDLNKIYLPKYIDNCWPEMDNLPQFAELFKAIVEPEETPGHSNKNKISLLNKIDRETFGLIVDHIHHFDEKESNFDLEKVLQLLKASEFFKMKDLMNQCIKRLISYNRYVGLSAEKFDLVEVLRFTSRYIEYENLNKSLLVKCLTQWPKVDNSLFCPISQDFLEDILMSPDFFMDDPHKILDMCSKWITHDVENRFRLIPEIALAISRNRLVNCDDHAVASPPDLNHCSEEFVKEKLWQILSSTSVLPSEVLSTNKKKKPKTEQHVFITCMANGTLDILDSDVDKLESLRLTESNTQWEMNKCCISATKINDNLFILFVREHDSFFQVYNFSLKKLFFLTSDSRLSNYVYGGEDKFTLLNCCKEIYCCFRNGAMLKYLFELNRWTMVSKSEPNAFKICCTSDGNVLYRIRAMKEDEGTSNIVEEYDFEQNLWKSLPNAPVLHLDNTYIRPSRSYYDDYYDEHSVQYPVLSNMIIVKNNNLAVLCNKKLILFNRRSQTWKIIDSLPFKSPSEGCRILSRKDHAVITQDKTGGILYVFNEKLYHMSLRGQRWEVRKKLPDERSRNIFNHDAPYENIIAIHNV